MCGLQENSSIPFFTGKVNHSTGSVDEEKKCDCDKEVDNVSNDVQKKILPGANLCIHNSQVRSWAALPGEDFIVIGGYESGVDAAVNLTRAGKKCKVLASTPCWNVKTTDPSAELAPYTAARLRDVLAPNFSPNPQLLAPLQVVKVEENHHDERGGFLVTAEWKAVEELPEGPSLRNLTNLNIASEHQGKEGSTIVLHTPNPPVLCTGFVGSVAAAASHLFDFSEGGEDEKDDIEMQKYVSDDDEMEVEEYGDGNKEGEESGKKKKKKVGCLEGAPLLTDCDESTKIPGVFLVGPAVSHGSLSFCFVYKFRQRFAIVAKSICEGLGRDTRAAISESRNANMYLDDFSCCANACGDVC